MFTSVRTPRLDKTSVSLTVHTVSLLLLHCFHFSFFLCFSSATFFLHLLLHCTMTVSQHNALLGNFGSWHWSWCYFDTKFPLTHYDYQVRLSSFGTRPNQSPSRIICLGTNTLHGWLKGSDKEPKALAWPPGSLLLDHLWDIMELWTEQRPHTHKPKGSTCNIWFHRGPQLLPLQVWAVVVASEESIEPCRILGRSQHVYANVPISVLANYSLLHISLWYVNVPVMSFEFGSIRNFCVAFR